MPRGRTYMIPEERRKEALSKVLTCPDCKKVMLFLESGDHNHDEFYCPDCKISAPCFFRGDASVSMEEQI